MALSKKGDTDKIQKQINSQEIDAYLLLCGELGEFLKTKQGPVEHALESVISANPILAKHNLYYGGSFNGNNCTRLLENVNLIFKCLIDLAGENDDASLLDSFCTHHAIWVSFAELAPLLCMMRKLLHQECSDLLSYIEIFASTYKEKSLENFTIKMHLLFTHAQQQLQIYGTLGFFSEDSMESIHALINRFSRVYASLDGE